MNMNLLRIRGMAAVFILCFSMFYPLFCFSSYADTSASVDVLEDTSVEIMTEETEFYDKASDAINEIYYNAVDAALGEHDMLGGKTFTAWLFDGCYYAYRTVADIAPYLIVFSVLIGIVICAVASKNKALRKQALIRFIVLIPGALIVFRFGVGVLIGIFK